MNDNYDFYDNDKNWAYRLCYACFIGFIICIVIAFFSSCKSIQYVPVPEYHHDSIYFTKVQFDSIWQHDSIFVKEYTRGDTVYFEHTKWLTKYKEKLVRDTSYVAKVDSIPVPYEVPAKLTKWQQTKVSYGGYALIFAFLTIIYFVVRIVKRLAP